MTPVPQTAFTAGEISPSLYGRADLAKYDSAARFIQNFLIRPAGGVSKRPGTRFVAKSNAGVGYTSPPRLIPFVFNQTQTYALEFGFDTSTGAGKIRFMTNAGLVVDGAAAVYSITHPYSAAELKEMNFVQSNDVMTLVHRSHPIRQLKRYGHYNWTLTAMELKSKVPATIRPGIMRNTKKTTVSTTAGTKRYKAAVIDISNVNYGPFTDEIVCNGENPFSATEYNRVSFAIPKDLTGYTVSAANSVKIGIWEDGVFYQSNNYNIADSLYWIDRGSGAAGTAPTGAQTLTQTIPWINAQVITDLDAAATTTSDSLLSYKIVSVNEKGEESAASAPTSIIQDLTAGKFVTLFWTPPAGANMSIRYTSSTGQSANVGVTLGTNSAPATFVPYKRVISDPTTDVVSGFTNTYSWTDQDGNVLGTGATLLLVSGHIGKKITFTVTASAVIDGVTTQIDKASVSWANAVAASGNPAEKPASIEPNYTYKVYRSKDGGQYQYIASTKALCLNDTNLTGSTSLPDTPTLFAAAGDYPGAVAYHQQRLVFAGSTNNPMTLWFSRVADFANFSTHSPLIDDDAMTITIAANETNQIQHLVPLSDLLVLTSGSEWRISGGQTQEALVPSNIAAIPQGNRGSAALRPLAVGNRTIFLQRLSKTVRAMAYSWEQDGYQSDDLSLMADHLTEGYTITDWAFVQSPFAQLFALRSDGIVLVCTILPEQQVTAWSRISLGTPVQALCVIPENGQDVLYLAVQTFRREETAGVISNVIESALARMEQLPTKQSEANALDLFLEYTAPVLTTIGSATVGNFVTRSGVGIDVNSSLYRVKVATAASMVGTINAGDRVMIEGASGFGLRYQQTQYDTAADAWINDIWPTNSSDSWLNGKAWTVYAVDATGIVLDTSADSDVQSYPAINNYSQANAFTPWVSGGTIKKAVTTLTGLDMHRYRYVGIIGDGIAENVTSVAYVTTFPANVTLPTPRFHVLVGLPFAAELKTLPAGGQLPQGSRRRVAKVKIRVRDSAGLDVTPDAEAKNSNWQPVRPDDGSTNLTLAGQVCKSFVFTQTLDPNWSTDGGLRLRSTSPLPCNILSIIPEVELGN